MERSPSDLITRSGCQLLILAGAILLLAPHFQSVAMAQSETLATPSKWWGSDPGSPQMGDSPQVDITLDACKASCSSGCAGWCWYERTPTTTTIGSCYRYTALTYTEDWTLPQKVACGRAWVQPVVRPDTVGYVPEESDTPSSSRTTIDLTPEGTEPPAGYDNVHCEGDTCPDQPCTTGQDFWVLGCEGGCSVTFPSDTSQNVNCPSSHCHILMNCKNQATRVQCWESSPGAQDTIDTTYNGLIQYTCKAKDDGFNPSGTTPAGRWLRMQLGPIDHLAIPRDLQQKQRQLWSCIRLANGQNLDLCFCCIALLMHSKMPFTHTADSTHQFPRPACRGQTAPAICRNS
jgi:hypothetical protein